ncbi:hypothetical protein ACH5RR_031865 [Cinchona calisaya]|uniref:Uncharacterized protein n=1 Tax=Cinchona calisaya TaxID=153742 RepID=A0ABD2YHJ5_9GENT
MAETSVANFMEMLRRKADSLVTEGQTNLGCVVEQIKHLKKQVEEAVSVVSVAESSGLIGSSAARNWLEKIYSAVSEADYLLDECSYEFHKLKLGKVRNYFSSLNKSAKLSKKIKVIRSRLASLLKESSGISSVGSEFMVNVFSKQIDFSVVESRLVQENNDVDSVINALLASTESEEDLSFVSIVGWGGVGKTNLARLVYNDVSVMYHFDERIWVKVSENFNINTILKDMFTSLTGTRFEGSSSSRDAIMQRLHEKLKGKRYLLVLDDVCDGDIGIGDSLMNCLFNLGGSSGSKVILTTCVEEVADNLVQSSFIYRLSLQSGDYCWNLFDQIAFADGGAEKTAELVDLARSIVRECRGNPLFVKLIGSLMYYMKDERQWSSIKESETWQDLSHGVPTLCYDHLPSISLKHSFLYCSMFPKDSVIDREELIQLWMVQGFLNPPNRSYLKMEDVGAKYYDILLRNSFLQVTESDEGDRKACKMNDLLHCFALSTSKGYCTVLENVDVKNDFEAVHLSLINCKVEFSKSLRDVFSKLRTLRLEKISSPGYLVDILMFAKDVQVLIVVDQGIDELPSSIGKLKHLKYLDISKTRIVKLPDSIAELYHLQTLRLHDLQDVPRNFENLVNLRYFFVESFKDSTKTYILPPKFRGLLNPLSYKAFLDNECKIQNLKLQEHPDRFSSLRIYRLENVSNSEEASKAKLSMMTGIESLKFHWNGRRENCNDEDVLQGLEPHPNIKILAIENFKGSTFPTWMVEPESLVLNNLVKVELENCCWCENLPPLGLLSHLKIVKITGMDNIKTIGKEFFGFTDLDGESSNSAGTSTPFDVFRMLKEFTLREMAILEDWSAVEHLSKFTLKVFPFLEKFEVEQCPKLTALPDIIFGSCCKNLKRLEIALCDNLNYVAEGMGRLESIEDLVIRGLPCLPYLTVRRVNNLRSLTIGCYSSTSEDEASLHLERGSEELNSLPKQLQYLSALRNLTIWGYAGVKELPEWLSEMKYLQILKLEFCSKLMKLPSAEKMKQLSNLKELHICYCPILAERCTRGSRPEWNKVSLIPIVTINYETVKPQS